MSVSEEVRGFIRAFLAENNKSLLDQFSKLVAESAEGIKRSSVGAADEQLREIKKMRREEPKSFKRRGNEVQYKFNAKLQDCLDDVKSHLESNAVEKAKASLAEASLFCSLFWQGNFFACGRFGHWRSECSLVSRVPKGNSDAR